MNDKVVFQNLDWCVRALYDPNPITDRRYSQEAKKLVYIDRLENGMFHIHATMGTDLKLNYYLNNNKKPPARIVSEAVKQAKLLSKL